MNVIDCLEVFVEVGKSLSFSKAADSLASSRSARMSVSGKAYRP